MKISEIEIKANNYNTTQLLSTVRRDGLNIRHIDNPSPAIQLAAIQQNPNALKFIKDPADAIKTAALKIDGSIITLIKNPSEAMRVLAVKTSPETIIYYQTDWGDIDPGKRVVLTALISLIDNYNNGYDSFYTSPFITSIMAGIVRKYKAENPKWKEWPAIEQRLPEKVIQILKKSY